MNKTILEELKKDLVFGTYGTVGKAIPYPIPLNAPLWLVHGYNKILENHILPITLFNEKRLPAIDTSGIEELVETVEGVDGNDVKLHICKPQGASKLPGLLYMHGGGMMLFSAEDLLIRLWRLEMAKAGFVSVAVEFRNSSGKLGPHPYPAGLNDGLSGLAWTHANREKLGISKLLITGESGGGNLALGMALRSQRYGTLGSFDGVYAFCPCIAGPEIWTNRSFASLNECDGYMIEVHTLKITHRAYDPNGQHTNDPCAWPLKAQPADMKGLPPHVISVNELDPLRDEGVAYHEQLEAAGIKSELRLVKGTQHAAELGCFMIPGAEHVTRDAFAHMRDFAESL